MIHVKSLVYALTCLAMIISPTYCYSQGEPTVDTSTLLQQVVNPDGSVEELSDIYDSADQNLVLQGKIMYSNPGGFAVNVRIERKWDDEAAFINLGTHVVPTGMGLGPSFYQSDVVPTANNPFPEYRLLTLKFTFTDPTTGAVVGTPEVVDIPWVKQPSAPPGGGPPGI